MAHTFCGGVDTLGNEILDVRKGARSGEYQKLSWCRLHMRPTKLKVETARRHK